MGEIDDAYRREVERAQEAYGDAKVRWYREVEARLRWERIAAERGARMDELQARAEDAETDAANARSSRDELLAEAREQNEKLREALRRIDGIAQHRIVSAVGFDAISNIARAELAEGEGET